MRITEQHECLLEGFLEELDWFIDVSRKTKMLEEARDRILEILERERNPD